MTGESLKPVLPRNKPYCPIGAAIVKGASGNQCKKYRLSVTLHAIKIWL